MTPERWARIKALFHATVDMSAREREVYLSEQCGSDGGAELRAEVERLLSAHSNAGGFIEQSPVAVAALPVGSTPGGGMTGRVIGRYQIGRCIGVGGMGQVYAARDLELGREVALKIAIDSDAESHARLRREAQQASRLNHSRICTIHEIGSIDGKPFIAMELVEGPTLAELIAGGPLAFDEALRIARQIIEALDEAHAQGVIHRDLKPANVKIRSDGTVKVLDFGLAKTSPANASDTDATSPVTRAGMIVGTPAYMAPEQVQGKPIDKRADIWAFGCVLYEMVTGQQPFRGETISDVLAAVLTSDPAWDRVPPSLQRLLRRCLERDPAGRLRDIGDATALLDEAPAVSPSSPPMRTRREWWAWSAAALLLVTTIAALAIDLRSTSPPALPQVRIDIGPPDGFILLPFSFVPSRDGRSVAFIAEAKATGGRALWIYAIASGVSREVAPLDGAIGASSPFWSPDGRSIGIHSGGKIRRVDVSTGTIETVCDAPGVIGLGTWNQDNVILFGVTSDEGNDGLIRVSASGGTPVLVTHAERDHQRGHGNPWFLPDGRHFVYQTIVGDGPRDLYVGSIDAPPEAQSSTPLLTFAGVVRYAPSPDPKLGYLLFMQDGKLMAQPFDNQQRRLAGNVVVVPGQASNEITSREFAGSAELLMYRRLARPNGSLVWVDRHGRETPALGGAELEAPEYPRLAPDGGRLAVVLNGNIWVYDLSGRPPIKLTFDGTSFSPLWTRDGRRLIFETPSSLRSIAADGTERVSQPASRDGHYHAHAWAGTEGELVGLEFVGGLARIVILPAGRTGDSRPIVNTRSGGENGPALSPDGRWLAYSARTTGREEIWVQPFPSGPPTRISAGGGVEPIWSQSGQELFYLEDQKLMAVSVKSGERFSAGNPVALFKGPYLRLGQPPSYDVSPDGRFLMIKPTRQAQVPITAIFNWAAAVNPVAPAR